MADQNTNSISPNASPNARRPARLNAPSNFTMTSSKEQPRQSPSPMAPHRQSLTEQLRHHPSSPRAQRSGSLSQQALQDLVNNPPLPQKGDHEFQGRDWRGIKVGEIVDPSEVHWAQQDTSVEEATEILVEAGPPNVVLIREHAVSQEAVATFDYSDLLSYLLLVVGLAQPDEEHVGSFDELAKKGRAGKSVPLRDISDIPGHHESIVRLPHTATLPHAVEIFASGVHRILVVSEGSQDVLGVLSQLRLVRFFWEYGRHFPAIEPLFSYTLQDLHIGSKAVRSINGDKPLSEALELMNHESITSLPVLDSHNNVVGNISHVDVRLLTKSTSLPLLRSTCIHFISVILSERGMNAGKDSFPVFYINPYSTLAHTVAKLVATRSHRMWVVDAPSPASSTPATPAATHSSIHPPGTFSNPQLSGPPYTGTNGPAVSASALPGQNMSGRLSGVVSLTDVLNLFARATGLDPRDPDEARKMRRRSSSISSAASASGGVRGSLELGSAGRSSADIAGDRTQQR